MGKINQHDDACADVTAWYFSSCVLTCERRGGNQGKLLFSSSEGQGFRNTGR